MKFKNGFYIIFLWCLSLILSMSSAEKLLCHPNDRCVCSKMTMTCSGFIPEQIPGNIKDIKILGDLNKDVNLDVSWENVTSLEFLGFHSFHGFEEDFFTNLTNLLHLGIHSREFNEIPNQTFTMLSNLKSLDFSGSDDLDVDTLVDAIHDDNLMDLERLNLDLVETREKSNPSDVNILLEKLKRKPIKELILTNMWMIMNVSLISELCGSLNFLNVSGNWIPDFSSKFADYVIQNCIRNNNLTMDLSGSAIPSYFFEINTNATGLFDGCASTRLFHFAFRLQHIYLNNFFKKGPLNALNLTIDFSRGCLKMNLKSMSFRRNNIQMIDLQILSDRTLPLENIDLSQNIIDYISPLFFKKMGNLKHLNLAGNMLYKMEKSKQFQDLFSPLLYLQDVDLSDNQLSQVQMNIFRKNEKLVRLNLSDNNIVTLEFGAIPSLKNIRHIDVSKNKITHVTEDNVGYLEARECITIRNFSFLCKTSVGNLTIDFDQNMATCDCSNLCFAKWVSINRNIEGHLSCIDGEEKKEINDDLVSEIKFNCVRSTVIITLSLMFSIIILLALCLAIFCVLKRRRQRLNENKQQIIDNLKRAEQEQRYLLFLSFCTEDINIALRQIYPNLLEELKGLTGLDENLVCTGDKNFRAGFPIFDEMTRIISSSYVTLFVVSNAFLESYWCRMEVKEAHAQNKPILLFFLEHIDVDKMCHSMKALFSRLARVQWEQTADGFQCKPDLKRICESIMALAAEKNITA